MSWLTLVALLVCAAILSVNALTRSRDRKQKRFEAHSLKIMNRVAYGVQRLVEEEVLSADDLALRSNAEITKLVLLRADWFQDELLFVVNGQLSDDKGRPLHFKVRKQNGKDVLIISSDGFNQRDDRGAEDDLQVTEVLAE